METETTMATGEQRLTPETGSTSGSEPTPRGDSTYVVQVAQEFVDDDGANGPVSIGAWVDLATVTVPARSKRKGIIAKALQQAGLAPEVGKDPLRVRVLDGSSSAVTEVGVVQPEPELRIG